MKLKPTLTCQSCGAEAIRTGATQRYCRVCSDSRDYQRKRRWARQHVPNEKQRRRAGAGQRRRTEMAREAGRLINRRHCRSTDWIAGGADRPLLWRVCAAVPFSYAASKNHIYALTLKKGHVALRRESRALRGRITAALRAAIGGRRVAHNKVWIDVLVQKPNHKGDAVNVIDLVCDAVKDALPVDDRWFCIRRLDWEVCKNDGQLIVGVGQESDADSQVCSYCGLIRPLEQFNVSLHQPLGVGRECKICRREGRLLAKQKNSRGTETPGVMA